METGISLKSLSPLLKAVDYAGVKVLYFYKGAPVAFYDRFTETLYRKKMSGMGSASLSAVINNHIGVKRQFEDSEEFERIVRHSF